MRPRAIVAAMLILGCRAPAAVGAQGGGRREDDALRLPPGFTISVFADKLQGVRYLTLGPGNAIYASQPGSGLIVKLTDANHDGVADSAIVVAQ